MPIQGPGFLSPDRNVPPQGLDEGEGKWLGMFWDGELDEWLLHGISTKTVAHGNPDDGLQQTEAFVSFHLSRKSGFFFWKGKRGIQPA